MLLPDTAARTPEGHLSVGGCDVVALAERFGTPLYVFDEATLRARLRGYRSALRHWEPGGDILYSAKAYLAPAMVRLLVDEGCGIDVVSGGELEVALRFGMAPERIGFAGNNKDAGEVDAALQAGIGHLVIDSDHEMELLTAHGGPARTGALLRVSPGVRPDTHDFISTGQLDSKFGFSIETGAALEALRRAMTLPSVDLRGVHMHIGSQILDLRCYAAAVDIVAGFLATARDRLAFTAREVSVGGGLGIAYTDDDDPPTPGDFVRTVTEAVESAFRARDLPLPALLVEPGRSVAGPAAVALYRVGARKEIPGVRTYVAVDGGMGDNIRPKLYGARYQPLAAAVPDAPAVETVSIAGRYCESTDILVRDAALPRLEPGDVLAVPAAGAYTLSMASNYNVSMRPAVVFVREGEVRLVRRRETLEDWLRCDVVADDDRAEVG